MNISESHLYPYTTLNNLGCLSSSFFITGVSNPLFKQRSQWWDVFANLDTGEIHKNYTGTEYLPPSLITKILKRSEGTVRNFFHDFTQQLIDAAVLDEEDLTMNVASQLWKRTREFEYYCSHWKGKVFAEENNPHHYIYKLLYRLRVKYLKNDPTNVQRIYDELDAILGTREDCLALMGMLPNRGDLLCLMWGLLIENVEAVGHVCSILSKLEEHEEGKGLISLMPMEDLNTYLAYKDRGFC